MVDKIFDRSNAVYVKNAPGKGRGLFANISFKLGDLIECAPTWEFDNEDGRFIDNTGLLEYYFARLDKGLTSNPPAGYIVFGLISMVNHSFNPNAQIFWTDEDTGAWASIVAIRDINVGEEITHRYTDISGYPSNINFIE
ncbi:SET domain-containing protein-lysine N-methyltransferase [Mesorhizobium sp. M0189]|uniref:SET domain-containing protein-lysine N-methyltransferase n=1 Tax=Mesorhizobium sp. M0189 TaxID=2956909 RepID=UPI0033397638